MYFKVFSIENSVLVELTHLLEANLPTLQAHFPRARNDWPFANTEATGRDVS